MADASLPIAGWDNFYVIVGSSGAALIGLQFVVMALIAERNIKGSVQAVNAFGTPVVVHLAATVLLAAVMSAPWPSHRAVSVALTLCGIAGLIYETITIVRMRTQTDYTPVRDDWVWHVILPCAAYVALTLSALLLHASTDWLLFLIAGATLSLLFIAIRNAWDTVVYTVTGGLDEPGEPPAHDSAAK
jgi:hypothetical protein